MNVQMGQKGSQNWRLYQLIPDGMVTSNVPPFVKSCLYVPMLALISPGRHNLMGLAEASECLLLMLCRWGIA
jgi:hypothetical protein